MPPPPRPRPALDPRHRRVDDGLMCEALAFEAWPAEMARGRRAEALAGAAEVLAIAVAEGAGFAADERGGRLFDPAEVQQFLDHSTMGPEENLWRRRKRIANREIAEFGRFPSGSATRLGAPPARFTVSVRRRFDLGRFASGAKIRLRLPLPLSCDYHRDVTAVPVIPPELCAAPVISDGRLEIRFAVPEARAVVIGADLAFTALAPRGQPGTQAIDPAEAELHLRPSEGLIQVTPRVRELARSLAGDLPPGEAVIAFWRYMIENFRFRGLRYEEIPADGVSDWVLDTGVYDCMFCSALFIALCRARGIPARLVTGHYLYRLAPTNHNWVEIWMDGLGWTPFDMHNRERSQPDYAVGEGWPEHFAQRGDYRLVYQRLPLAFTGPMSVRFPPAWQMLHTAIDDGVAITYADVADGRLIYRDEFRVLGIDFPGGG